MARVIQAIEHVDSLLNQEILLIRSLKLEHIEANRIRHVSWVKVDNILYSLLRHLAHQRFNQISVRVNKRKAPAIHHILVGHVLLKD